MPDRRLNTIVRHLVVLLALAAGAAVAQQDPLLGTFSDGQLQVSLQGTGGQYSGQMSFQGQTYPFNAQGNAQRIDGSFHVGNDSFPFGAGMQGDALVLVTGGATYTLARQAQAGPAPQAAASLAPGTRIVYRQGTASHPGTNAGPDARGVGGDGYVEVNIIFHDGQTCAASISTYMLGALDRSLTSTGGSSVVAQDTCSMYWASPAMLRQLQSAPETGTRVVREPFTVGGQTYDAVIMVTERQDYRSSMAYDQASGLLLMATERTGDLNYAMGGAPTPSTSGSTELLGVRQVQLPWSLAEPLPDAIRNLQGLRYQGTIVNSMPGIAIIDTSYTTTVENQLSVQQRGATFLHLRVDSTITQPQALGGGRATSQSDAVLSNAGAYFLPPSALARLQVGQVLDQDPITGIRLSVERVDANAVSLVAQSANMTVRNSYDPRSGLLLLAELQQFDGVSNTVIRMELVGSQ